MWDMHDGMGWWMIFGMAWTVIFWVAIIGLIVWAVSRFSSGGSVRPTTESRPSATLPQEDAPIEIAKKRYARGEITREEFEQVRQDVT
jgi:putative membrane protein